MPVILYFFLCVYFLAIVVRSSQKMQTEEKRVASKLSEAKHDELVKLIQRSNKVITSRGCSLLVIGKKSRFSLNKKEYVQIKVKTPNDAFDETPPNRKAQLHQIIAWNHPNSDQRAVFRTAITEAKLEISHTCSNKSCTNAAHLCAEDSLSNKSRWGCPAVIYINNDEYPCCKHHPRCIPSEEQVATALKYTV